ncbi:MAG: hypothetical protein HFE77_05750 [Clostridiales bacterium]|nr:hypothetical protein [Clostridiales bacterium]
MNRLSAETEIWVELKTQNRQAAEVLADELTRTKSKDRVVIMSRSREIMAFCCEKGLSCAWRVERDLSEPIETLSVPAGAALVLDSALLDEQIVIALHDKGVTVFGAVSQRQKEAQRLTECGVDGMIGNVQVIG